ncbi:2OG-Fe dioxygenase family protein [Pseudomonas syringae]|uniref:2OG-Fe dioxygenase family protein n=1 Tax=Pseudomonas syringae TaxID=317 RepID=UPI000CD11972|nr:2OG-Fe dioxygenase family protein [Pseudomonas syringae]MBS7422899.1 2OG-Fe dioxygenase family protein [Pseudomonas syringae]MBS7434636.1 2OG-Fe dioxygenase family protein [Pseudomonas syringae]MCF5737162.1 hypothetical protein [Pseudomonas syringae]MCF5742434.1 hypothetical protein [Pseudomonas syringae]MCF5753064.1 hypothetical protein [Pseudomonas syringae]
MNTGYVSNLLMATCGVVQFVQGVKMGIFTRDIDPAPTPAEPIKNSLARQHWAHTTGTVLKKRLGIPANCWKSFTRFWENLALDEHLPDEGAYRYRRYGAFELFDSDGELVLLPHDASEYAVNLASPNGGVAHEFISLEEDFVRHPFFAIFIRFIAEIVEDASKSFGPWQIRVHPCRVVSDDFEQGKPTPEGLHRDGADFIVMLLVNRLNVTGGITKITNNEGRKLVDLMLCDPMDMIIANDQHVMHEVSPIDRVALGAEGYRDVLLVSFKSTKPRHLLNDSKTLL